MTPANSHIDWAQIPSHNAAFLDGSSFRALAERAPLLTSSLDDHAARRILHNPGEFDLWPVLGLLERWIAVDTIIVDLVALASTYTQRDLISESFGEVNDDLSEIDKLRPDPRERWRDALIGVLRRKLMGDTTSGEQLLLDYRRISKELSVSFTVIPQDVFRRCHVLLSRTSQALRDANPELPWKSYGFGKYKDYGEALQKFYGGIAGNLARSHLGIERTLVYYEVAAAASAALILHPEREAEADAINQASANAFETVRSVLSKSVDAPLHRQLELLGIRYPLRLPALIAKSISEAGKQGISIIESARRLRSSTAGRSFRRWLAELQSCLDEGTPGGRLEALRMLEEVQQVASQWSEELDSSLGVHYDQRQLELSWIPRIGGLLEGLEKRTFKDPILNRKGYLTFMSSWYKR